MDHQASAAMTGMDLHHPTIAQRKFQVFISSTFQDLVAERRAVTEAILGMGHIPVGMELFEAGNDDQWTYIQNRINEVDYYLVIVAERYGSLGRKGLSYTEMEYRFAVEQNVPVAALLLHSDQRAVWPRDKVDFENRDKLEKFRKLCQKRMVSYWLDAGTLSAKCQLALTGLIRASPRTGWVSADQAISPQLAVELARLSQENAGLRAELSQYANTNSEASILKRIAAVLGEPLIHEFERLSKTFGGRYGDMLQNPVFAQTLASVSLFDLLLAKTEPFLDGETESEITGHVRSFLDEARKGESDSPGNIWSEGVRILLLRMKVAGLLEAFEGQTLSRGPTKKLRLSDLGRKGFDYTFSQYVADNPAP